MQYMMFENIVNFTEAMLIFMQRKHQVNLIVSG